MKQMILDTLTEIVNRTEDLRMDYFNRFPEDANEYFMSWNELYRLASDDNITMSQVRTTLKNLIETIKDYDE